jgi:hypothetical protein
MINIDIYLTQAHSARWNTTFIAIAVGASAGAFIEWLGGNFNYAFIACVIATGAVEILRAFLYTEPARKEQRTRAAFPIRRHLVWSAVSSVTLLAIQELAIPRREAYAFEQRLQGASSDPANPSSIDKAKLTLIRATAAQAPISSSIVEGTGKKFIDASANSPEAWGAVLEFVKYKSYANNSGYTGASLFSLRPVQGFWTNYTWSSIAGQAPPTFFIRGRVPEAMAARYNRIGQDKNAGQTLGNEVLAAVGGTEVLDGMEFRNVIFRGVHIVYFGGPVIMENVRFMNCNFEMKAVPNARSLALAILAPTPSTTLSGL